MTKCDLSHLLETTKYDLLVATMQFMCLIQSEAQNFLQISCVTCIKDEVTTLTKPEANADLDPRSIFRQCLRTGYTPHEYRAASGECGSVYGLRARANPIIKS